MRSSFILDVFKLKIQVFIATIRYAFVHTLALSISLSNTLPTYSIAVSSHIQLMLNDTVKLANKAIKIIFVIGKTYIKKSRSKRNGIFCVQQKLYFLSKYA
jgi:hypothetical protein